MTPHDTAENSLAAESRIPDDPAGRGDARAWAGTAFAVVAFVEAGTWAGLLTGMYLKYVTRTTEAGVQIFGALHGYAFLTYLVVAITAAVLLRWRWGTITLALLAAIPPLMTIPLEIWMRRTGRLRPRPAARA